MKWRLLSLVLFSFFLLLTITSKVSAATIGGINIGPYYEEFSQAATAIGAGGWVYVLGCPGNIPAIQAAYKANPQVKLMIRAYFKYPEIDSPAKAQKLARDWANVLKAMDTPNVVYFMPANEINNPTEKFIPPGSKEFTASSLANLKTYLDTLQSELSSVRGSKVMLLSPSIDPFQLTDAGVGSTQAKQLGTINWGSYDGISVSLYGQYTPSGALDTSAGPLKRGEYSALSNYGIPSGKDIYVVETGVIKVGEGVAYQKNSSLIVNYLKLMQVGPWSSSQVKAATIFSYNPDKNIEFRWIYSSPVASTLRNLGGGDSTRTTSIPPAQFDWNSLTACNLKNKSNLEPIVRACTADEQNPVVSIPPLEALKMYLNGQSIASIVPENPTQVFPNMDHSDLTAVAKKLTPNHQKYVPAEEAESAIVPNGKQAVTGNKEPMPKTSRFSLQASANTQNGGGTTSKNAGSTGNLYNADDDAYLRKLADDTAILGKYTSRTKLPSYDLTVAPEIIQEGLVPCSPPPGSATLPTITTSAQGINLFESTGDLIQDIRQYLNGAIAEGFVGVLDFLNGVFSPTQDRQTAINNTLNALGVQTQLCSCTGISHGKETADRANLFINSMIPNQSIKKIKAEPANAKSSNQYKLGDQTIAVDNTSEKLNQVDKGMTAVYCSSLPNGTDKYRKYCKGEAATNTTPGNNTPVPPGGALDYDLPYKNTSCTVSQTIIDTMATKFFAQWTQDMSNRGIANMNREWEYVQTQAIQLGINPAFAIALAIEESAFGGFGGITAMGCAPTTNPTGASRDALTTQLRCLNSVTSETNTFMHFMCRYSGETGWRSGTCSPNFSLNPNFPGNIKKWYGFISETLPQQCKMSGTSI